MPKNAPEARPISAGRSVHDVAMARKPAGTAGYGNGNHPGQADQNADRGVDRHRFAKEDQAEYGSLYGLGFRIGGADGEVTLVEQ